MRLLEAWSARAGIGAVVIEYIDIIQPHSLQTLIKAGEQVLSRTPFAVRPGPHQITCLCRDDEFIAVARKVLAEHPSEGFLG